MGTIERDSSGEQMRQDVARYLGEWIKAQRKQRGYTQGELAALVGVDEVTIRRWELGLRTPRWSARAALSKFLTK